MGGRQLRLSMLAASLVLAAAFMWACDEAQPTPTAAPTAAPTAVPTDTPAPTAVPTETSSPTSTPSPVGTYPPTNTPYPHPLHPCGPSHIVNVLGLQEHFLHWTPDGSRLVFDVDDTIWVMDLRQVRMWQIADLDLNYNRESDAGSMLRFEYGFHADVSPDGSSSVFHLRVPGRQAGRWEGASRIGAHNGPSAYEMLWSTSMGVRE